MRTEALENIIYKITIWLFLTAACILLAVLFFKPQKTYAIFSGEPSCPCYTLYASVSTNGLVTLFAYRSPGCFCTTDWAPPQTSHGWGRPVFFRDGNPIYSLENLTYDNPGPGRYVYQAVSEHYGSGASGGEPTCVSWTNTVVVDVSAIINPPPPYVVDWVFEISPTSAVINSGATQQFVATWHRVYSDGSASPPTDVTQSTAWEALADGGMNIGIGTIDNTGLLHSPSNLTLDQTGTATGSYMIEETGEEGPRVAFADVRVKAVTQPSNELTIKGDVYSGDKVSNLNIQEGSVVSAKNTIEGISGMQYKIPSYDPVHLIKWELAKQKMANTIVRLKNERKNPYSMPATISGIFNLNPSDGSPNTITMSSMPEGQVWYRNGDLTLDATTFLGKGTIIVEGNVNINGNLSHGAANASLGIIATGNITIDSSVTNIVGAYYTTGKIEIK